MPRSPILERPSPHQPFNKYSILEYSNLCITYIFLTSLVDSSATPDYSRFEFPSTFANALNPIVRARKLSMRQDSSGRSGNPRAVFSLLCAIFSVFFVAGVTHAQTQQPFLFATTQVSSNSAVATFTRNDATGALSEVAGSPFVLLTPGCYPATMDPKARFLLGSCGDGISLYQFNNSTGIVSEVPNSPFAASTGGPPDAVIAESTGQFAYALRIIRSNFPTPSSATLDSFTIDATNNVLSQPSSQVVSFTGTFLGLVVDPNDHFIRVFLSEPNGGAAPLGSSCTILFDPQTGLPVRTNSGLCQLGIFAGSNPLGISIDSRGTFIGTSADGQFFPNFDVFAVSPAVGSVQGSGIFTFTDTNDHTGTPFFDPTGQLVYANSQFTGLRIFSLSVTQGTVSFSELPSSPLPSNLDATPLHALADPAADFTYIGGSNLILSYPIDITTGYPGTPLQNSFNHNPALNFQPVFATMPPPGQPVSAPEVFINTSSLSFGPINPGQTSGPQTVTISSTGNEALTISSITFSPTPIPFSKIDGCMTNPVLAPGTSCQVSVSYSPASVGVTQAALVITDNAAGSPQSVALTGTAVAPPPPAPEVTLTPGTLSFPGMTTQGESSAAQSITITNSGNATLTFSSAAVLSGVNTADFSISSNTCGASLVANASCSVGVVFSPLAAGVRTTALIIADNASGSPQSVTINGTAAAAATFTATAGASASVSAGQPAVFPLQAMPGTGFNGSLAFACSGTPTGATCSAPGVSLNSNETSNFSVTVTTSGSASLAPFAIPRGKLRSDGYRGFSTLFLIFLAWWLYGTVRGSRFVRARQTWRIALSIGCFALALIGCGGGGGGSGQTPQAIVTPSGTYNIVLTPSVIPASSSKNLALPPITLTLIVK